MAILWVDCLFGVSLVLPDFYHHQNGMKYLLKKAITTNYQVLVLEFVLKNLPINANFLFMYAMVLLRKQLEYSYVFIIKYSLIN